MIRKIYSFLKTIVNVALDLSLEKAIILHQLNTEFKQQYLRGEAKRLVVASISMGDMINKHEFSSSFLRSGFMLTIMNDNLLKTSEANEIALYLLENDSFVRQLMILGFDTFIIKGKSTQSIRFKMSDYAHLKDYFL